MQLNILPQVECIGHFVIRKAPRLSQLGRPVAVLVLYDQRIVELAIKNRADLVGGVDGVKRRNIAGQSVLHIRAAAVILLRGTVILAAASGTGYDQKKRQSCRQNFLHL